MIFALGSSSMDIDQTWNVNDKLVPLEGPLQSFQESLSIDKTTAKFLKRICTPAGILRVSTSRLEERTSAKAKFSVELDDLLVNRSTGLDQTVLENVLLKNESVGSWAVSLPEVCFQQIDQTKGSLTKEANSVDYEVKKTLTQLNKIPKPVLIQKISHMKTLDFFYNDLVFAFGEFLRQPEETQLILEKFDLADYVDIESYAGAYFEQLVIQEVERKVELESIPNKPFEPFLVPNASIIFPDSLDNPDNLFEEHTCGTWELTPDSLKAKFARETIDQIKTDLLLPEFLDKSVNYKVRSPVLASMEKKSFQTILADDNAPGSWLSRIISSEWNYSHIKLISLNWTSFESISILKEELNDVVEIDSAALAPVLFFERIDLNEFLLGDRVGDLEQMGKKTNQVQEETSSMVAKYETERPLTLNSTNEFDSVMVNKTETSPDSDTLIPNLSLDQADEIDKIILSKKVKKRKVVDDEIEPLEDQKHSKYPKESSNILQSMASTYPFLEMFLFSKDDVEMPILMDKAEPEEKLAVDLSVEHLFDKRSKRVLDMPKSMILTNANYILKNHGLIEKLRFHMDLVEIKFPGEKDVDFILNETTAIFMISCIELLQNNLNGEFLITKQLMESKRRYMKLIVLVHTAFDFFKYAANCDDWSQLSVLCSTLNIHLRLTHISTITSDILRVCLTNQKYTRATSIRVDCLMKSPF